MPTSAKQSAVSRMNENGKKTEGKKKIRSHFGRLMTASERGCQVASGATCRRREQDMTCLERGTSTAVPTVHRTARRILYPVLTVRHPLRATTVLQPCLLLTNAIQKQFFVINKHNTGNSDRKKFFGIKSHSNYASLLFHATIGRRCFRHVTASPRICLAYNTPVNNFPAVAPTFCQQQYNFLRRPHARYVISETCYINIRCIQLKIQRRARTLCVLTTNVYQDRLPVWFSGCMQYDARSGRLISAAIQPRRWIRVNLARPDVRCMPNNPSRKQMIINAACVHSIVDVCR